MHSIASPGRMCYCVVVVGGLKKLLRFHFFSDAGFPCPTRKNPPEHFLRCVSTEFDSVATFMQSKNVKEVSSSWNSQITMTTEEIKFKLLETYKNSMHSTNTKKKLRQIKLREEIFIGRTHTSRLKQLCILTRRSFLNMVRDIGYYWLRILFFILASVNAGFIYYNIGSSNEAILSKGKFYGFVYGFMIFICVGALPFYLEELKVFKRERFGRHYWEDMYVLSHFLSSLPFVIATSLSSGTILYYMVKFHEGFSHYCYFSMNLFLCISVAEGCMLFVAALVSNQLVTIVTAAGVTVFMLMPSSIFRRLTDLPKFFWRYPMSYISYIAWSVQGQFKNDMIGLEF
ncbi:hypothetical protein P8452_66407 [Trifolium repens]|nr:hypothetical protein P8452_66407 [Trifolium repens]